MVKGKQTQCKSERLHCCIGNLRGITLQWRQGILKALLVNNVNINLGTRPNKMKSMNELFIFQISVPGDLNHNLLSEQICSEKGFRRISVLTFTHSLIELYKPSNMRRTKRSILQLKLMQNYNLTTLHLKNHYNIGSRLWVVRSAVLQSKDLALNNCWLLLLPPLIGWAQWAGPPQHQSVVLSNTIWWHHIPLVWIRLGVLAVRWPAELTLTTGRSHQWHERVHAVEMRKFEKRLGKINNIHSFAFNYLADVYISVTHFRVTDAMLTNWS